MNEFFTKNSVKGEIAPQSHLPSAFKLLLVSILLLLIVGSVHAGLTDNLVAYYNFNETSGNLLDQVSNNDGTNSNVTQNQTGIINKAYSYNGSSSRTYMSSSSIFDYEYNVEKSFCLWFNKSNSNTAALFGKYASNKGYFLFSNNTGTISYNEYSNGGAAYTGIQTNNTFSNSNWHYVCVTSNGNGLASGLKIYVNGQLQEVTTAQTRSGTILTTGVFNFSDAFTYYGGLLDEAGIWNRILTQNEITVLYNGGSGLSYPFDVNVVLADFDYVVTGTQVDLNDTSTVFNDAVIDSWEWLIDDVSSSTDQNYSFTGVDATDYNVCLIIQDTTLSLKDSTCQTISISDLTPPITSFESNQITGSTDQNIVLTCDDGTGDGCKTINFRINNGDWNYYTIGDNPLNIIYSGVGDHNIQFYSTDNADNNETIKTSTFTTYGNGRFYFKDENSGSDLTGVQVNFNGVDYNSGANNYLDFNFQTLSSTNATYLFTISKSGYSTRYYQTDLNYFGDFNNTFALIPETLATNIQFKMFPPTGTTALANTYIEFKDKDTNYTITRLKSNENGELTANLKSDDQNYLVWISEGTYIYQAVQLTILYPKDEQTLNNITGNWRIEITDNISYQDLNIPQGTNKIIYLLPNTKYPFTIAVQDVAGTYFKRKWSKIYQGNPLTDTLQPYLVNADDGIAVKFVFQDPKRDSIENIIINIYKNVGGIKTLISSGASDVTGNALFFLIAGDKYTIDFSYDGTIIFETQNYTVTSSTVYWTINLATREIKTVDGTFITIGFNPIQDYILKNATNISYKVTASKLNRTQAEFYIIQDGNKIITYTRDASCTTPCTVTIPIEDLNITLGNKVYLDLNVYIDSNNYIFNYKKTWSYGTTSNIDTHDLFVKARIDFGCTTDTMWPCPLTSIVSIIIMILLIGSMVFTFNFVNPKGLLVAGLGILAVFTYLGWFWWVALVLIIIASIFYLRGD